MTSQDPPITVQDPPTTHRFAPMAEAVRILGLSATTIRRKIDAGELEAERVPRPQGVAWLVKVPNDLPPPTTEPPGAHRHLPGTPQEPPATPRDPPLGTDLLTVVVAPLLAEVAASRQAIERQVETIRDQAERLGYVTAERDAALAELVTLKASHSPAASNLTVPAPDPAPPGRPPSQVCPLLSRSAPRRRRPRSRGGAAG
jgi:hypothetical protein